MNRTDKYVDVKVTVWNRIYYSEDTNMDQIVEELKKGIHPQNLWGHNILPDPEETEMLDETEMWIRSEDNKGSSTIQVYDNDPDPIWENKIKI